MTCAQLAIQNNPENGIPHIDRSALVFKSEFLQDDDLQNDSTSENASADKAETLVTIANDSVNEPLVVQQKKTGFNVKKSVLHTGLCLAAITFQALISAGGTVDCGH